MRHKGVVFDSKDHPDGLATLIVADNCTYGCKNCINECLKSIDSQYLDMLEVLRFVFTHTLEKRVVLGGLEWTEQRSDLYELLDLLEWHEANVILYTHWTEDELRERFPRLLEYNMYIKYGAYIQELASNSYYSCGIPLASTNQYIKKNVVDKP